MGVTVMSLLPAGIAIESNNLDHLDKIQHTLAYAFLTFIGLKAFPHHKNGVLAGLCIMGAVTEIIQGALPWRQGELLDMIANTAGIFGVYGIFQLGTVGNKD